jgi:hypothetical protein
MSLEAPTKTVPALAHARAFDDIRDHTGAIPKPKPAAEFLRIAPQTIEGRILGENLSPSRPA